MVSDDELGRALRDEQVRLHRSAVPGSLASAAVFGPILVALLWNGGLTPSHLLGWLALLGLLVASRAGVRLWYDRAAASAGDARWLARYRLSFALHGFAWAAAAVMLMPEAGHGDSDVLVFALAAVSAGALVTTVFDPAAAFAFAAPVLIPLFAQLFGTGEAAAPHTGTIVALFLGATAASTLRVHRTAVRDAVQARLAERHQAAEARRREDQAREADRALAEKHRLTTLLLENTPQGFWHIDNDGLTVDVNPAMCALLGRPREQVVGRGVYEFFRGDQRRTMERQLAARREGRSGGYEITIVRPDGTRAHCLNHATPLRDGEGRQIGSIGLWTDLTALRENEQQLRIYEAVANALPELVSVVGEDLVYRMVNDSWCRTMGVAREQAVGRLASAATPQAATPERLQALRECIVTGRPQSLRGLSENPRYADRWIETTFHPFGGADGAAHGAVAVTRDITAQEQARAALAESAEYLRRTLNATGDAIFASDAVEPTQPVRFVNDQMLAMWGIPAERAANLTPADIMGFAMPQFEDPAGEGLRVQQIIASAQSDESRVHLRDGRVLVRRCIPANIGGRMVRVWSFRDVTAEERAMALVRTREAEQRALLDAFPGLIARIDGDERYTYVNRRLAELHQRPPEEIVGRTHGELFGEQDATVLREPFRRALAGESIRYERHHEAALDRPAIDLQVTLARGIDPTSGAAAVYVFGVDVTALEQAKQALRASEAAMAAARDEAQRANRAKSQFLAQMSHELRTPMNAILGFGQLLASDSRQALAPVQKGWVQEILHGGRHLLDLINDVLDLGRVESGALTVDPSAVALRELVDECLGLMRPLAASHNVRLENTDTLPAALAVSADRMRLKQVLLNLLGNAIKYNRPGGHVDVICRPEGGTLAIGVRDTGHGLTAAEQARLFQPFERLGAEKTDIEGTGIGLVLSRRLAEAMGGTLTLTSTVGEGSTFWIRLPAAARGDGGFAARTRPTALDGPANGDACVLYIEDNAVNVMLMEAMLARLPGVRMVSAATPLEGLQAARSLQPALILLDIQLPGMDGYEVLRRLRARAETREIPVVAVTASAMGSEVEAARAAGFDDYLTKPLDLDALLAAVQRVLGGLVVGDAG